MVETRLIGDKFISKWCHFSTTVTLFNQVIHHNDKVKPKKSSSLTTLWRPFSERPPYRSQTYFNQ